MGSPPSLVARPGSGRIELTAEGSWTVANARNLDGLIDETVRTTPPTSRSPSICTASPAWTPTAPG